MRICSTTRKLIGSLLILISLHASSYASDIKGYVYDKNTGDQLIGATITITPGPKKTVTALDGSFSFKNIKDGIYNVRISFVDYKSFDTSITVNKNSDREFHILSFANINKAFRSYYFKVS